MEKNITINKLENEEEAVKLFEDKTEIRNNYYDSFNLDEYLKDKIINNIDIDGILKYAFDSQKGNIFYFKFK